MLFFSRLYYWRRKREVYPWFFLYLSPWRNEIDIVLVMNICILLGYSIIYWKCCDIEKFYLFVLVYIILIAIWIASCLKSFSRNLLSSLVRHTSRVLDSQLGLHCLAERALARSPYRWAHAKRPWGVQRKQVWCSFVPGKFSDILFVFRFRPWTTVYGQKV